MPTKAELEQTAAEYADFRQQVVDVGLRYATAEGWCDVVKRALTELGLADLIPGTYTIECRYEGSDESWSVRDTAVSEQDGHRALAQYIRARTAQARREYRAKHGGFQKNRTRKDAVELVETKIERVKAFPLRITIEADSTVKEIEEARMAALRQQADTLAKLTAELAEAKQIPDDVKPDFEEPVWPKYRLIYKPWRGRRETLARG